MLVSKALEYINTIIKNTIDAYKLTDDSKDNEDNYITHPLENKTDDNKLEALYFGLRDATLNTIPLTLLESNESTATEFKKISTTEFVRVPNEPTADGNLDIDEGLSFAVIYKALSFLWNGYSSYASDADAIYANFDDVMRDYFSERETDTSYTETIFFRYSNDGTEWHDNYQDGDIYISFKQGDGVWSNAIKFVGEDGAEGSSGGASTFLDLTDTPDTYTADKILAVNSDGNAIIQIDAPTGGAEEQPFDGMDGVSGNIAKNFKEIVGNYYYVDVNDDLSFDISKDGDDYEIELGKLYTIEFIPNGHDITLAFDAMGDKTIDSSQSIVMVDILFDSIDIYIMAIRNFA